MSGTLLIPQVQCYKLRNSAHSIINTFKGSLKPFMFITKYIQTLEK